MSVHRSLHVGRSAVSYLHAGNGERAAVLVHCSASSPSQWRALLECAPRTDAGLRLFAPALGGYAGTHRLDGSAPRAEDDPSLLASFIDAVSAGGRVDLVGHSYGAATALAVALAAPGRVRSLTLIEPVVFGVLEEAGWPHAWAEIETFAREQIGLVDAGRATRAARAFVSYWSGSATWQDMSDRQRANLTACMRKVADEWRLLQRSPIRLSSLVGLSMPIRLLVGERTTPAMHAVMDVLRRRLPRARWHEIPRAGHMAPITHVESVNRLILSQLRSSVDEGGSHEPLAIASPPFRTMPRDLVAARAVIGNELAASE